MGGILGQYFIAQTETTYRMEAVEGSRLAERKLDRKENKQTFRHYISSQTKEEPFA